MFETARYLSAHPDALDHPEGPIGHYLAHLDPVASDFQPGPEGLGAWWRSVIVEGAAYDEPVEADVVVQISPDPDWRELWWSLRALRWQRANDPESVISVVLDDDDRFAHAIARAAQAIDDRIVVLAERPDPVTVVLLKVGTIVNRGWLQPLLERLDSGDVRAVAPVVLDERGVIRSAGQWGDQQLFAGFALEDVAGIESVRVPAVSDVCLARRGEAERLAVEPAASVLAHRKRVALGIGDLAQGDSHQVAWLACGFTEAGVPQVKIDERPPRLRWALKHCSPPGPRGWRWGDSHFAELLAEQLRALGQHVVLDARPAFDRETNKYDDINLVLRGEQPLVPVPGKTNLAWVIYDADQVTKAELDGLDRVYVASQPCAQRWQQQWSIDAIALLQACEPSRFHPDLAEPDTGAQVLFVGNSRQSYRPLVMAAAEAGLPLTVYGQDWETYLPESMIAGQYLANDQVGAAYRAASVVLCDHRDDMRSGGFMSNRLFDAVAAGARVISDDVSGIKETFGDCVQIATGADDLRRLMADLSVFGDDAARRAAAAQVAKDHSFAARARTLLDDALELRRS